MKKILTFTTKVVNTGFAVKDFVGSAMHPLVSVRNFFKKILIKTLVSIIKKAVHVATKDNCENNAAIRQLNALGNPNADMTGLSKKIQFKMTLDSILEQADENEINKFFKLDISSVTNKISSYKNYIRQTIYEYLTENDFENLKTVVLRVNDVLKMPTQIVGCEFVNCSVEVESHDTSTKNFLLNFDVNFALKSS